MMNGVVELCAWLVSWLLLPFFLVFAAFSNKLRTSIPERLGFGGWNDFSSKRSIWIHAASMGELEGVRPFIKELRKRSSLPIVITTTSQTGRKKARELEGVLYVELLPVDVPTLLARVVAKIDPAVFFNFETEIWPNLFSILAWRSVPIVVVNGRISDKSYSTYRTIRSLIRPFLEKISLAFVQSQVDKERFHELGVSEGRLAVAGCTKFDSPVQAASDNTNRLRAELKIPEDATLLVCGSVRPGETEIILRVFKGLKDQFPNLKLLLAPRHPERFLDEEKLVQSFSLSLSKRSAATEAAEVFLLDSLGELKDAYSIGDLCFVGGTLVPIGGHNPMEPAQFGKPVIFGQYTGNVKDAARDLKGAGAAREVEGEAALKSVLCEILTDRSLQLAMGQAALSVSSRHVGASERIFEELERRSLVDLS